MLHKLGHYALWVMVAVALAGCGAKQAAAPGAAATNAGPGGSTDEEKVLNVYNWSDYIAPDIVPAFEKEYGIKVNYDFFDSNDVLQTKLLTGHTGYDIVVPSADFMALQIKAGAFRKLDKSLIPNLKNVDPDLAARMDPLDPGMEHGAIYFLATLGLGYNVDKIKAAMPDAPVDSFRMFYDPNVVKHFKDCGVTIADSPTEVVSTVLLYLGRNPNSEKPEDLAAAEKVLMAMRSSVRYIDNFKYMEDLANGETCLALGWSGDVLNSAARAREADRGSTISYNIPREGAALLIDCMAIPADAPHPRNAHLFINYMWRPEVSARNSSLVHYAIGNTAAYPLVDPAIYNNPAIYPTPDTRRRLVPDLPRSATYRTADAHVEPVQVWPLTVNRGAADAQAQAQAWRFMVHSGGQAPRSTSAAAQWNCRRCRQLRAHYRVLEWSIPVSSGPCSGGKACSAVPGRQPELGESCTCRISDTMTHIVSIKAIRKLSGFG